MLNKISYAALVVLILLAVSYYGVSQGPVHLLGVGGFVSPCIVNGTTITGCTAAGGGTVTSIAGSNGVATTTGLPITASGTLWATQAVTVSASTSYAVQSTDRALFYVFTSSSPIALTLPQAGTGGFVLGWYFTVKAGGTANVTVTPITSTIDGAASKIISSGSGCVIGTDGTNYYTQCGGSGLVAGPTGTITISSGQIDVTAGVFPTITETQFGTHLKCAPTSASGTAYVCATSPAITTSYSPGMMLLLIPDVASSGSVTLDAGQGAKKVFRFDGVTQAITGDLVVVNGGGVPVTLQYQSTLDSGNGGWVIQGNLAGSVPSSPTIAGTVTLPSNSAASTPILYFTGTWITGGTGTTTFPHQLMQPTGATAVTTWSTNGTAFGINSATGFTGNFIDVHLNGGASLFRIDSTGNVNTNANVFAVGSIRAGATFNFSWVGRSIITSPADGQVQITNSAATSKADVILRSVVSSGSAPGIAGCTATIAGAPTFGEITSGTTGTCSVTLTFATTAPTGWVCNATDITTPADILQTATSVTATTASLSGTTTSGDKIRYACVAY